MKEIDYKNWNRKEHFEFFSKYDNPFFGIVTEVDCTEAFALARKNNFSFFAWYLHRSLLAVNRTPELKLRLVDGKVMSFDEIHAATTIGREDGTFGFSHVNFSENFEEFSDELKLQIDAVKNSTGLRVGENSERLDVVHYSTLPWFRITGVSHAKNHNSGESVPKITFGKSFLDGATRKMGVSVEAHHGLVDGIHIARFMEEFQSLMAG
ncbi:chloramphenicol acetyltransferase [Gramella sp. KN1008]|uniref:chloramphenicol acetyltransferase n=1 Tax=Gramella sp. KN1008 TaxID=2529298 RepID=UPI00103AD6BB|nr:chloramphenicol acetyltransferase [Gramella sp. KN1008]TBW30022.1 chloramphenicol acetyltransferase [Gramella sp. KN1008]